MPKISLAGWSLHRRFLNRESPLRLLDFPRVAKEEFGIDVIELNNPFFESTEESYLSELKRPRRMQESRSRGWLSTRRETRLHSDEAERRQSIDKIKQWFPVAKSLGLPFFRVNTGGHGRESDAESLRKCIQSFTELAKEAEAFDIKLVIENHWGISANPLNIVRIVDEVGSPYLGTLPDFGNFPDETRPEVFEAVKPALPDGVTSTEIRYWGLELMAPYAIGVHAKMYEFDEDGNDTRIDVARCVDIFNDRGLTDTGGSSTRERATTTKECSSQRNSSFDRSAKATWSTRDGHDCLK